MQMSHPIIWSMSWVSRQIPAMSGYFRQKEAKRRKDGKEVYEALRERFFGKKPQNNGEEVVKAFPAFLENVKLFFDQEKYRSKKTVLEAHIEFIRRKKNGKAF